MTQKTMMAYQKQLKFRDDFPNHELEILESKYVRGTEEDPRADWRKPTRSMWKYKVRNNKNNRTLWVCATWNDDHLEQITKNLMGIPNDNFWNSKKQEEQLLKDQQQINKNPKHLLKK